MSTYNTGQEQNVIYQADPAVIRHLHGVRDSLHQSCKPYLNHKVNVQTIDGLVHEGTLAGVDNKHLYLNVAVNGQMQRGYYNPYQPYHPHPGQGHYPGGPGHYPGTPYNNNVILPLVLFELLAISLL
ncbi:hypothetical protein [Paenibacillus sp. FSL R10-2734]|uniref:hypothetical protein n=1 Tax=Paenibacillus sp. FSL R10-2734 TaxID=2954691 RepID=UPI0030DBB707